MKAIVLSGPQVLTLPELPKPEIEQDNEVLVQVQRVGICGSDIHYYTWGRIGDQVVHYPHIIGHECSAIVSATGPGVKRVRPGDLVAVDPALSCYQCDQCRAGRWHTCRQVRFLSAPGQLPGCLREYLVVPQESCFKVPARLNADQAALVEPLSVSYYAVQLMGNLAGKVVAILGAGPIGLGVLIFALRSQASRIYVTDRLDYRLEIARHHGACWTGNPDREDVVTAIDALEPQQVDIVFECCGEQLALDQAIGMLKPGGKLGIVGIPAPDRISFDISQLRRQEITILNVRRQNECFEPVLNLLAQGEIAPEFLITHHFNLTQASQAFDLVAGYRDRVLKAMIDFN